MKARFGDITIASASDDDLALVAAVTGLSVRTVRGRFNAVRGNTLVRNVFSHDWPHTAGALGALTVGLARDASLEPEIAEVTDLSERAVSRRLDDKHGNTLVASAFPELQADQGDGNRENDRERDDDESECVGEDDWDPEDPVARLAAVIVSSVGRSRNMVTWLAERVGWNRGRMQRKVDGTHGNTRIGNLLAEEWPVDIGDEAADMLSTLRVGVARRSRPLIAWIAIEF